jgi:hypothetical protein
VTKVGSFEINSYSLDLSWGAAVTRIVWLQGKSQTAHLGERTDFATLYFKDTDPKQQNLGVAYVFQPPHSYHFSVRVFLPLSDFDTVYRLLQAEKTLFVHYKYLPSPLEPDTVAHRVISFRLGTQREPLGEDLEPELGTAELLATPESEATSV